MLEVLEFQFASLKNSYLTKLPIKDQQDVTENLRISYILVAQVFNWAEMCDLSQIEIRILADFTFIFSIWEFKNHLFDQIMN